MMCTACVPRDDEEVPRAKRLPRALVALEYHDGARALLANAPVGARALIGEACEKLPDYFGHAVHLALSDVSEVGETHVQHLLYLVASSALDPDEASLALDRFFEEWWLDNVARADGHVRFGLELV